ncbi:hypothetical protein BHE74_00037102 [Ensete ventricosum]|nr:hypothetical protein GW17_00058001 [Ensete ventricosum]RWW56191.1 hypothetical protein BHE74_00037102 [Ensete ventricosum]RZS22737.1 hypothetical protein BHM03_00055554 [Ensete ventricosum]
MAFCTVFRRVLASRSVQSVVRCPCPKPPTGDARTPTETEIEREQETRIGRRTMTVGRIPASPLQELELKSLRWLAGCVMIDMLNSSYVRPPLPLKRSNESVINAVSELSCLEVQERRSLKGWGKKLGVTHSGLQKRAIDDDGFCVVTEVTTAQGHIKVWVAVCVMGGGKRKKESYTVCRCSPIKAISGRTFPIRIVRGRTRGEGQCSSGPFSSCCLRPAR